jgi:hypothetical protein
MKGNYARPVFSFNRQMAWASCSETNKNGELSPWFWKPCDQSLPCQRTYRARIGRVTSGSHLFLTNADEARLGCLQDEEVGAKKPDYQFNRGSDGPPVQGNNARSAPSSGGLSSARVNRTPSLDSDHLILAVTHPPCIPRFPLAGNGK